MPRSFHHNAVPFSSQFFPMRLLFGDLNLARLDVIGDVLGAATVNLAASAKRSAKDFFDGALQIFGHGLEAHGAGNVDDLIEGNALGVLDVLLLLPVTWRLLEGLDDERRGRRHNGNCSLTVLDGQLDRDAETLPVASGLGNVFTDLYTELAATELCSTWRTTYS